MTILTDIDGVVIDWFSGFKKYVCDKKIPTKSENPRDWELDSWLVHKDIPGLIQEYNETEAFGFLEGYQDAMDIIPQLHHAGGITFKGVTASSHSRRSKNLRYMNLNRRFGLVFCGREYIQFVEPGTSKEMVLSRYHPTVWIEDRPQSAVEGFNAGHTCFLMDRPYNQGFAHPGITRIKDWYDFGNRLRSLHLPDYAGTLKS
jgi:hypothetical protein